MQIISIASGCDKGNNYTYLLLDTPTKNAWIIDPGDPDEVLNFLNEKKIRFELKAIVNTHHHYDHSRGNNGFHLIYPDLPIIAGVDSPLVNYTPAHNEVIDLGDDLSITALHTPCHTRDSICYFIEDFKTNEHSVFTGDTLFTSGCGKFFEGTGEDMNISLNHILAKLPKDTKVYPGHEYTLSNLKFTEKILDSNLTKKLKDFISKNKYAAGHFTIGDELEHNPFMRPYDVDVQKKTGKTNPSEVIDVLRKMKNES